LNSGGKVGKKGTGQTHGCKTKKGNPTTGNRQPWEQGGGRTVPAAAKETPALPIVKKKVGSNPGNGERNNRPKKR